MKFCNENICLRVGPLTVFLIITLLFWAQPSWSSLLMGVTSDSHLNVDEVQTSKIAQRLSKELATDVKIKTFSNLAILSKWISPFSMVDLALVTEVQAAILVNEIFVVGTIDPDGTVLLIARAGTSVSLVRQLNDIVRKPGFPLWPNTVKTQLPPFPSLTNTSTVQLETNDTPKIQPPDEKLSFSPPLPSRNTENLQSEMDTFEQIVLSVSLNQEVKGDHFFLLKGDKDVFVKPELLNTFGLNLRENWRPQDIDGQDYLLLQDMSPEIQFDLEKTQAKITIIAQANLFEPQHVDFSSYQRKVVGSRPEETSLIFNYRLSATASNDSTFDTFNAPMQLSAGKGPLYGLVSVAYNKENGESIDSSRQGTSLIYDRTDRRDRFVVGDFTAVNGLLGGSDVLGGISLSSAFEMDPYFKRFPRPEFFGAIGTPAQVDIYVNDTKVKSESLRPGEFSLSNIPSNNGYGEMKVVTKDAFGQETESLQSFYVSPNLLSPGLHEYSYNLGWHRNEPVEEVFSYEDLSFLGSHRLGLTPYLTGGLRIETREDLLNLALTSQILLSDYGELELIGATSSINSQIDEAVAVAYQFSSRKFHFRAFAKHQGKHYENLSLVLDNNRLRNEISLSTGVPLGKWGSVNYLYGRRDYYQKADTTTNTVFYSKRLSKEFNLNCWARNEHSKGAFNVDSSSETEVFVGLTWFFDYDTFARYEYNDKENRRENSLYVEKTPPVGNGLSYNLRASRLDNGVNENHFSGRASYRAPYGVYDVRHHRIGDQEGSILSTAGAMSAIDKNIYFSKPINDSMAVVRVGNLPNVGVNVNNQEYGKTNKKGFAVVPSLNAYRDNHISINDADIPVNYRLDELDKYVSPYPHSGATVNFSALRLQGFTGKIFINENKERRPAVYASLKLIKGETIIESVVGKGGEFYMENLSQGQTQASLWLDGKVCDFIMAVPSSKEMMVDMGEIDCVIH